VQLGPLMNNIVAMESFLPAPTFNFPGVQDLLEKYRSRAAGQQIDPFGYAFVPFAYAAGQILAQAVNETKSLDHEQIATYIHATKFNTVVGEIAYNTNGDWTEPRTLFTQFQDVQPNDVMQFRDSAKEPIIWPEKYKTGKMIYPYSEGKR
jgi:branched-chain amino acid transport system substrate-binding protein